MTNQRWLVADKPFGGGGGGDVYLCFRKTLVQATVEFMRQSMNMTAPDTTRETTSMHLLERLYQALTLGKDGLAALKIPKSLQDSRVARRLTLEITAMNSVTHPSLIKLLDNDEQQPPCWFVMEYHPGGDLTKSVAKYKGLPLNTLLAIRPVVEGVAELHRLGYVHRDIKPKNIFVGKNGELLLGDFGIVFPPEEGTRITSQTDEILSRDWIPDWIRFDDAPPQRKVDVFMLAKVIYFMVSGGCKVLASQLAKRSNDLTVQFPDVPGMSDVYILLKDYITTDEEDCKAENAEELLRRLDQLIYALRGDYQTQLVFSFLSTHSTTDVQIRPTAEDSSHYPGLRNVQLFLPRPSTKFRGFARVLTPGPMHEVSLSYQIASHASKTVTVKGAPVENGIWSGEVELSIPSPLARGVHRLDVIPLSPSGGTLTAFMLYAE